MKAKELNYEDVAPYLSYEPETGVIRWTVQKPRSRMRAGSIAGCLKRCGYIRILVNGESHQASRIAWVLFYKSIDVDMDIDHIDRDRTNNRISNLRLVTRSENCMNKSTSLGEKSPRYYTKHKSGKFQVVVRGKYVGLFSSAHEAIAAIGVLK